MRRYARSPWGHKARHHGWEGHGLNVRSRARVAARSYGYYPSKPSGPGALTADEREAIDKPALVRRGSRFVGWRERRAMRLLGEARA